MFIAGCDNINSSCVDTAVTENISELGNVLFYAVKGTGEQVAQIMGKDFSKCISGVIEAATVVELEDNYLKRLKNLTDAIVAQKIVEPHHQVDNQKEQKRFMTGFKGEAALEELLGISIIDWSAGDSKDYHIPDIPGYNVGIKAVEYGKFPVIFKKNYCPQIICVIDADNPKMVYICGLATPQVLNTYQDDSLIIDPRLRARGTKTGFYGFDHLVHLSDLEQIKKYRKL